MNRTIKTLLLLIMVVNCRAATRYVTVSGAGIMDGSSWSNAAPELQLQTIINSSGAGDDVWVACGAYRTTTTTSRGTSFILKNGVTVYGSFAGTETLLSQRDLSNGLCSILTGEIGSSGNFDNSYHVISNPNGINNTAIIDGFIIENANDDRAATLTNGLGGGIYNNGGNTGNNCSPTIRNCVIQNNSAQFGAGVFNSGQSGGNSSPLIINCVFINNTAYQGGGAIDNFGLAGTASPTLVSCVIYSNTAAQRAGGIYCWGGNNGNANPLLINCTISNNSSVNGGGFVTDIENSPTGSFSGNSNPTLQNCVVWGNTASATGPQFFKIGNAGFNATYTDLDLTNQNIPHTLTGATTGNINSNPQFVNINSGVGTDGKWLTADDNLKLQSSSPCINAGNNHPLSANDILNSIKTNVTDIGAYEFYGSTGIQESSYGIYAVFPNPFIDNIHIKSNKDLNKIEIHDLTGKLVHKDHYKKGEKINLSVLSPGVYYMSANNESFIKLVKVE